MAPDAAAAAEAAAVAAVTAGVVPIECSVSALQADVVLGTEVLYTEAGLAQFVATVGRCLRRPNGMCYVLNNRRRTGVARLESECARHGLEVVRCPPPSDAASSTTGVVNTFAPPWDDDDSFALLQISWAVDAQSAVASAPSNEEISSAEMAISGEEISGEEISTLDRDGR
jgi:hypothetical protein